MELMFSNGAWVATLLLLLAATIAAFFLLRWGSEKVQKEARRLSGELRAYEAQQRQFQARRQQFSAEDPEPYGGKAAALQQSASQVEQELPSLRESYIHIQGRLPRKLRHAIQAGLVSPLRLLDLHSMLGSLEKGLAQSRAMLEQLETPLQELEELGWQEASNARQAAQELERLDHRLNGLSERHAYGPSFDALQQHQNHLHRQLERIPDYFFSATQEEVLSQADKATVIQVHQIQDEMQGEIQELDRQSGLAEQRLVALDRKIDELRQEAAQAETALDALPVAVDSSALQSTFRDLQVQMQRLQAQLSRPDLDKLSGMEASAKDQLSALQELEATARHVHQDQNALEFVLNELSQGMKEISNRVAFLGTTKSYRILWTRTSNALANMSQQVNELGEAERQRTPAKLAQDLEKANQLILAQQELSQYLQQTSEQHAALVELLEGPELGQAMLWVQNTQKHLPEIQGYDPGNWARADAIVTLPEDLRKIDEALKSLGASRPGDGIAEEQLTPRLEAAQRLGGQYQSLRARASVIESRLAELKLSENQARQTLETIAKNLAQVGFIVNSNPVLVKQAGQEIERFQKQIEKQLADLAQRQKGTVDSKARQASGLALRIEQGLDEWLAGLDQDTQEKGKALTASLTRLDSIAPLEDAPALEARRLLVDIAPRPGSIYRGRGEFPLETLVLEYKRRSEQNQACTAVQKALADLESPVVASFNTAQQNRQQVQDLFHQANNWLRQGRAWPPVAVDAEAELQTLGRLEADWAGLREKPIKAIELVKCLGDLARQYQALASSLGGLIEQGNRQQKDIHKLESQVDAYLDAWEKIQGAYTDNPQASEDIHKLLNEADQEMFRVKSQYNEGRLNYDQVQAAIQALHRRIRLYQAVLDDTHVVDVTGKVITSRDSQRAPGEW
jgi:chromosome segregation ATPase